MRPGREEGDAGKGPQPRPQAERSRGDRPRWALRSVRHRVTDRRAAEQPETRAGNEGQETAASEEEERHRGRLPRKAILDIQEERPSRPPDTQMWNSG